MSTDMTSARLAFGVTHDQADEIERLLRIISAHGDVVWAGSASELNEGSLPVLGETIYEAAEALGNIFERIGEQTLKDNDTTATPAKPQADLPAFDSEVHDRLMQAHSIMLLMERAAQQEHGMDGASDACRLVSELLWKVNEYIADHFDSLPKEAQDE